MANSKHIKLPTDDNRARSLLLLAVVGGSVQYICQANQVGIAQMNINPFRNGGAGMAEQFR